jgi:hypothetical protein
MTPTLIHKSDTITRDTNEILVNVKVLILTEGEYFVAYSPSLQLSSFAKTPREAKSAFDEALRIFLEETTKRGTLERLLLNYGWTLRQKPDVRYVQPAIPRELLRPHDPFREKE